MIGLRLGRCDRLRLRPFVLVMVPTGAVVVMAVVVGYRQAGVDVRAVAVSGRIPTAVDVAKDCRLAQQHQWEQN